MMDEPPSKAAEVRSNYESVAARLLCRSRPRAQLYLVYHLGFLVLTHHWVYTPMINPGHHIPMVIIISAPNIVTWYEPPTHH